MVAMLSYQLKTPVQDIRRWTIKQIKENFEYQMYIMKKFKEVKDENGI